MPFDPPRELTDPKAMRALAHPVRLALLEALTDAGALTATEAGEGGGGGPPEASFHPRPLAEDGVGGGGGGGPRERFVSPAPAREVRFRGGGGGRDGPPAAVEAAPARDALDRCAGGPGACRRPPRAQQCRDRALLRARPPRPQRAPCA